MSSAELPPVGSEVELRCEVSGAAVTVRAKSMLVDFTGGCRVEVAADPSAADSVRLRVLDLQLVAELPDAGGPEDGGTITVRQNGSRAGADSSLRPDSVRGLVNELVVTVSATIDQPDGTIELAAGQPVRLTASLSSFPPTGERYELAEPVDFVLPDNPDTTTAQISELVMTVDAVG